VQLYVGCSGWSYSSWDGHFYPKGTEPKNYLSYYSKVFDYVEIDSTFYRIPNSSMTNRWAKITPDNFRFTAKVPKLVTHDKRLGEGIETDMEYFYKSFQKLKAKVLCLLVPLPPSMTMKEGLKKLEHFPFEQGYRYAVEARHKTWFDKEVYKTLSKMDLCLVWNQLHAIKAPPVLTTDFAYIRFIGDRSIDEKDLGKIQKYRLKEMKGWAREVKKIQKKLKFGIVAANNHYAGFGPVTANQFRQLVGMPQVVWDEMKQSTLNL